MHNKTALVTGASSGIGKATFNHLVKNGWTVYGTSRQVPKNEITSVDGGKMIYLDLTDNQSIKSAINLIHEQEGRLDALVNNADYGIAGSIEYTSYEEMVSQFNTNFFGTLRTINASVDILRKSKGIIVNISSVAGALSIPFQGMYSASKAALESASEALRLELKPDKIRVCLVQPGDTKTGFTSNRQVTEKSKASRYSGKMKTSIEKMEKDEQNGTSPETTAKVVYRMIKMKNPPVKCAVGLSYKILLFLKRFLPHRTVQWIIGKMYA